MKTRFLPLIFDPHVHLRQGELMGWILRYFRYYHTVVAMGNTTPPIIDAKSLLSYKREIEGHEPPFKVIYSIMLVNSTTPHTVEAAYDAGARVLKLIPSGASTNSDAGVPLEKLPSYYESLKRAKELGMIFSIHLELTQDANGKEIPEINREEAAIPYLEKLVENIPDLKIVVEHASTSALIEVIKTMPNNVAATLTAHHAILTIDDVMEGDRIINPHHYCKPIAKTEEDVRAVIEAMTSGDPRFFFGSDSAAHPDEKKLAQPPAAGIFSAPVAISLLYQIFVDMGAEEHFDDFISTHGRDFYGLPDVTGQSKHVIIEKTWTPEKNICDIHGNEIPVSIFMAGETLSYSIQ